MPTASSSEALYDNLIVGGGISGLGLAHHCVRKGLNTLLLESEPEVGGCIHSHAFAGADGFWTELGSHTCYNSYGHLLDIVSDLGLTQALQLKRKVRFKVLQEDRLVSVFSRIHPLELAFSVPRLFRETQTGKTVKTYYSRVLGERNYRDLFGPAFNAVICQQADDFPADMLFRKKPRRKDMPRSFTLADGLSAITRAMADQPGLETRTGTDVARIERDGGLFRVTSSTGEVFESRRLSLATPPDVAAGLLRDPYPELAGLLSGIGMSEIESMGVAVPAVALEIEPLAGIIAPHDDFFAAVSRDYLDDSRFRGFTFHFRPGRLDPERRIERICRVLGIAREDIETIAERRNRLPALRPGHRDLVANMDRLLAGGDLALTGNYFIGVSIEDCLTRSRGEFERLFA